MKMNHESKILVLGVDGMDPSLTKKYLSEGRLPNIQKFINCGACREDLVMLGGMPTITPPMWTTLATGSNPGTHGITCFWNQSHEKLDTLVYALDSRKCKSEQLWNVFAEAGKQTLVFHWPGSSWPPSSESSYLHVVDGNQPCAVNMGIAGVDAEKMIYASTAISELSFRAQAACDTGAGCVLTDLEDPEEENAGAALLAANSSGGKVKELRNIELTHEDGELALDKIAFDVINSPIKEAVGWANAPENAKEFVILTSKGLVRRPALILQNEQGVYDRIEVYKSKKDEKPIYVLPKDVFAENIIDVVLYKDQYRKANRHARVLDIAEDGNEVRLWMSGANDLANDHIWYPKTLYKDVVEHVGMVPVVTLAGAGDPLLVEKAVLPSWDVYSQWQAKVLNHFIKQNRYEVIFSHLHNIDCCGHGFWYLGKAREHLNNDEEKFQEFMAYVYEQTDDYIGAFLPLLDEGWTIFIVSDHGLLTSEEEEPPLLGDAFGINIGLMQELGYTTMKTNDQGEVIKEIDWSQTKAVAARGCYIWINLKGRDGTGIVEPEEKYELERCIIDDLYNYRLNGKRVISLALRNKDAALLGLSGDECGDIVYFLEEGFNRLHGDSLSTQTSYQAASVSPIFMAAGCGIKKHFVTQRVIREIDVAPTIATIGGVRMPAHCEGAPVYQILEQ